MLRKALAIFFGVSGLGFAGFDQKPWMGEFLQFHLKPSFSYRYYPDVSRSYSPSHYSSHDRFTQIDLSVAFLPNMDLQLGMELADTSRQSLGVQSAATQLRYQWLSDTVGAPVSLTTAFLIRWASPRSLKDVSCPYSANWNFELVNAIGKEYEGIKNWLLQGFAALGVGQASHGRPYLTSILAVDSCFLKAHTFSLFAEGYFGFGHTKFIDVSKFRGYGNIFHQSIDLGIGYTYTINEIWGKFSVEYARRVFAKAFPEKANTFIIKYDYPFSPF